MADDLAALLDHLKVGPVSVLGWSDGGIEALLLGIRHPAKVKKIAAMATNLNPSEAAMYPEFNALIKSMIDGIPAAQRDTPQGKRELKVTSMMLDEPHIDAKALEAIAHAGAGERSRHRPRRADHRNLPPHPQQPVGHLPERDAHGSLRRPGVVQRNRGTVLPHPVCEEGPDQRHAQVLRENANLSGAAPPVSRQPGTGLTTDRVGRADPRS